MTDLQLHELLKNNKYTLAVLKEDRVVFHSQERGLKPLYQLYRRQPDVLRGGVIADKVTGKAAAMLAVLGGAREVYSDLISEHALQVLESGGVKARYGEKSAYIINRTKTGMCPMESLVMDASSPEEGVARLVEFFENRTERKNTMEQRKMRNTGEMVSLLGLGCMRFPHKTPGSDDIDEEKAEKMIDYAIKHGVNYFDTAYPYHGQRSEPFLGRAMKKYPRDSFYLASKLPMWYLKKEEDVSRYFEEQLQRCQVEYFDFYLCHAMNEERFQMLQEYRIFEKLTEYKKQGKIRHIGFSFHDSPEVLEKICSAHPWEFAQIQLNYLDWDFQDAKTQYEILERHDLPAIIMEPVRGGALADLGDTTNQVLKQANEKASIASWAIRYAASLPNVLTVLSGMSTDEQLADNIQTMTGFQPLSDEERKTLANALEIYRRNVLIPCTGCRYCADCPVQIDIPLIFRLYNHFSMNRHTLNKPENEFLADYEKIEESCRADQCIGCQNCVSHCPQNIQVPEELGKIASFVSGLQKSE